MLRSVLKRAIDISLATIGLVILGLPMLIISLIIALTKFPQVLFRQKRPGCHGRPFLMYKFRTMSDTRDPQGNLLPDTERLTPVGRFLRGASLDELPELFNVIKGDMSLVGPRPLLMEYLRLYTPEQARRQEVKPGITGWAQVNGRNALSWEEKFLLDVWYVDNWNLLLDFRILWLTLIKVLKQEGISGEGCVTMDRFEGSPSIHKRL